MSYNNLKISMATSLETPPKKDLNSTNLNKKRKKLKNKKLHMKVFANYANKS
jgi:hypothetical protein